MNEIKVKQDPRKEDNSPRLNPKLTSVITFGVLLIVMVIVYVVATKGSHSKAPPPEDVIAIQDSSQGLTTALQYAPSDVIVPQKTVPLIDATTLVTTSSQHKSAQQLINEQLAQEWLTIRKAKNEALIAALTASSDVEKGGSDERSTHQSQTANSQLMAAKQHLNELEQQKTALSTPQKNTMLDGYLDNGRQVALTPYELTIGTLIPASLIGAINSDISGTITAQITQTVYDSATGAIQLLPQGSKLVGNYQGQVAFGQARLPVQWYRINFPDGSKLNLGGMNGIDTAGQNGFNGNVDNHYWRLFGQSTLLGLIAGGTAAAVSDGNNNENSPSENIANGVVAQYAQTGTQLIQKNLQISPTITVPNGYEFNIILTKDVVLPPYQQR